MTRDLEYYLGLNYPYELVKEEACGGFFAQHPDLDGCIAEGRTADEAIENLDESRELWIEARLAGEYPVPEPLGTEYSGRVSLRMPSSLHRQLAAISVRSGASLNMLLNTALADYVGGVRQLEEMRSIHESTQIVLEEIKGAISSIAVPNFGVSTVSPSPPHRFADDSPWKAPATQKVHEA